MKPIDLIRVLANLVGNRGIVCGGCCRDVIMGREPKDYDIFIFSEEDVHKIGKQLNAKLQHRYDRDHVSVIYNAFLRGKEVQLVYGDYLGSSPKEVIAGFPFTICQFWYDRDSGQIVSTPLAKQSVEQKTLIFNKQGHVSGIVDRKTLRTFLVLKGSYLAEKLELTILPNSITEIYEKYS